MADVQHRTVTVRRIETGVYRAINERGDELTFGSVEEAGFTPVELLLAAIGGCSAVDVDVVTERRAVPDRFEVVVEADKVRDEVGNILRDIQMTFRITFPDGDAGDQARALVPRAVKASHERACTVSRTVEAGTPVSVRIDDGRS
jgi:putative redox protein